MRFLYLDYELHVTLTLLKVWAQALPPKLVSSTDTKNRDPAQDSNAFSQANLTPVELTHESGSLIQTPQLELQG